MHVENSLSLSYHAYVDILYMQSVDEALYHLPNPCWLAIWAAAI